MDIQNESLGEQRIRDLNDEINKLLREKGHWERRIIELGGANYRKYERIADDAFLSEISPLGTVPATTEHKGYVYKYFGAARNLPGVKELHKKKQEPSKRIRYASQVKGIDAEYYGYRDADEGVLETLEQEAERKAVSQALKNWEKGQQKGSSNPLVEASILESDSFISHVSIPTKQQIEQALVERRKEELMKRYVSEELKSNLESDKKEVEVVLGKRKNK